MRISLILFITVSGMALSDILLSDDFNDGNANGWFEYPGVTYDVIDGEYCCWGAASSMGLSYTGDIAGFMSVPDYSFRAKVRMETGFLIGLSVRFSFTAEYIYALCIGDEIGGVALVKSDGSTGEVLDLYPMPFTYDQPYWMRFEIQDNLLGGKIWIGTPEDEPSEWMVRARDSSVSTSGSIALFCQAPMEGDRISMSAMFDDVEVSDNLTLELHAGTWASIKSSF